MEDMYDSDVSYSEEVASQSSEEEFLSDEDGPPQNAAARQGKASSSWTVIDRDTLTSLQKEALDSVISILGCSVSTARTLLIHFRWDTETLFGAIAEDGNERVFKLAGVTSRNEETPRQGHKGKIECGTCFCEAERSEATQMTCGHIFCNFCWQQHFRIQISEGKSRSLRCMAVKCGAICDEDKVKPLIAKDPALLEKYEQCLLESYIEDNKRVKWCPSVPHCGRALQVQGEEVCEPSCECGHRFCFACTEEPHSPCTCQMWAKWRQKCQDDSETRNWLTAHTKPCPKCGKAVEKNGGCNLVTCMCQQSFCWLCGAATGRQHTWERIDGHSCGRYKEEVDRRINEAERNVKRYLHYYKHWEAHVASQKLEQKQTADIQDKIAKLEEAEHTLHDYSWLMQALEQLFHARRILGFSYVLAYFMFGNEMFRDEISSEQNSINQNLFEDQQAELERHVERLSGLIEADPDKMDAELRYAIINATVNTDARLVRLYGLVENDLLGRLQFSVNYIAPYKGQSMQRPDATAEETALLEAAVAQAAAAASAAADGAAGPSGSTPEVVDLTHSPASSTEARGARKGREYGKAVVAGKPDHGSKRRRA